MGASQATGLSQQVAEPYRLGPDGLQSLARLCEEADEPSRGLDALIAVSLGLPNGRETGWCNKENGDYWVVDECAMPFTASLDAAMTLVDPGAGFLLDRYWLREGAAWTAKISTGGVPENPARQFYGEDAKTAPLAVCAAALRARDSDTRPKDGDAKQGSTR